MEAREWKETLSMQWTVSTCLLRLRHRIAREQLMVITYQSFVFCEENSDASVNLADCQGNQHCCTLAWDRAITGMSIRYFCISCNRQRPLASIKHMQGTAAINKSTAES